MTAKDTSFGVLTLATPNDYLKAIGLALSLRASNPGVPTAVACSDKIKMHLAPYFDYVIEENPSIRGFEHKVHLDRYSPFNSTFFFDSDVLVFKPVQQYAQNWGKPSYTATGLYATGGVNGWGLDRAAVLKRIGRGRLHIIDGAGHAFFNKPGCYEVFQLAREITQEYKYYAGDARYADEDAMAITMTILDLPPVPYGDFFSRYLSARPGTMEMDASRALCRFVWTDSGKLVEPCMIHFAMNEAPFAYTRQLLHLFRAFNVPTDGLITLGLIDYWTTRIKWPLSATLKALKRFPLT